MEVHVEMKNKAFSVIAGLILVGIGVGYCLKAMNILPEFTVFFAGWWTVFIILPGLVMLFSRNSNKFVSLFLIALGVALFLQQQEMLVSVKKLILPALIVLFGLSIILSALFGGKRKKKYTFTPEIPEDGSIPVFETSFGEVNPDYSGRSFDGCSMDITFGSGELDLRNAIIDKEVTINVNAAFAGVEIMLPQGCRVDLQTSTSFGGTENKYVSSDAPDAPVVHIFVSVSFGGVEIK